MDAYALRPLRIKSTGAEYLPGERVEAPEEKLRTWAERGLVLLDETESPLPVVVASDGRVLAWSSDPPHIRLYAWALQNLGFVPVDEPTARSLKIPSGEMDRIRIRKLAGELHMGEQEVQAALDQMVKEGDLMVKTERGGRIYWLATLST